VKNSIDNIWLFLLAVFIGCLAFASLYTWYLISTDHFPGRAGMTLLAFSWGIPLAILLAPIWLLISGWTCHKKRLTQSEKIKKRAWLKKNKLLKKRKR